MHSESDHRQRLPTPSRMSIAQLLAAAQAERQAGNFPAAREICQQILREDLGQPDALSLLAMMAHRDGHYGAAIEHLRGAIAARPGEPIFHYNLGTLFHEQDLVDEAIGCYRQALAIKPG